MGQAFHETGTHRYGHPTKSVEYVQITGLRQGGCTFLMLANSHWKDASMDK